MQIALALRIGLVVPVATAGKNRCLRLCGRIVAVETHLAWLKSFKPLQSDAPSTCILPAAYPDRKDEQSDTVVIGSILLFRRSNSGTLPIQ